MKTNEIWYILLALEVLTFFAISFHKLAGL